MTRLCKDGVYKIWKDTKGKIVTIYCSCPYGIKKQKIAKMENLLMRKQDNMIINRMDAFIIKKHERCYREDKDGV